jgi:hypothetical protein
MRLSQWLAMSSGNTLPPEFVELIGTPTTNTANTSTANFSIEIPSHQPLDLLVVTVQSNSFASSSIPVDWNIESAFNYPDQGNAARVLWKIAQSDSETFTMQFRTDQSTSRAATASVWRSETGRVPKIEVVNTGTGDTIPTATPSAGTQKYSWLLGWFGKRNTSAVGAPTPPSGYSEIAETNAVGGTGRHIRAQMAYKPLEASFTTPGAMLDAGGSTYSIYMTAVIWE